VSQKINTFEFDHNFGKCRSIVKILSLTEIPKETLQYVRVFRLTLTATILLH